MQFLISVIDDQTGTASASEMAAIDAFNAQVRANDQWVLACGISAPREAVVIDGRGPEPVTIDGPLHDAEEYLSGFWVVRAGDVGDARLLAAQASAACHRRVELRPLL